MVLDASMALAWLLKRVDPREATLAQEALDLFKQSGASVPVIWYAEVANAALVAERQRVITIQETAAYFASLFFGEVVADAVPPKQSLTEVLNLSRIYALTSYDATYLELALRTHAQLATFDRKLAEAARSAGVNVFGDPA